MTYPLNTQPKEDQIHRDHTVDLHSMFFTIQGEGPFAGRSALFIRLAGCNLQCPGCDTEYTQGRKTVTLGDMWNLIDDVLPEAERRGRLVVVTGGEPFRQNLTPLLGMLHGMGFEIQIETNGTLPIPQGTFVMATVVCSPKGRIHPTVKAGCRYYKYVLQDGHIAEDGLPSSVLGGPLPIDRPLRAGVDNLTIYVQPMDEKDDEANERNLLACVESVKKHGFTLCIQIHKIIGVE